MNLFNAGCKKNLFWFLLRPTSLSSMSTTCTSKTIVPRDERWNNCVIWIFIAWLIKRLIFWNPVSSDFFINLVWCQKCWIITFIKISSLLSIHFNNFWRWALFWILHSTFWFVSICLLAPYLLFRSWSWESCLFAFILIKIRNWLLSKTLILIWNR